MRPLGAVPGYPGRDPSGLYQGSSQRDPSGLCWGPWGCARVSWETPQGCSGVSRKRCQDCSRVPKESPLRAVPGSQAEHPAPHPQAALAVGLHTPPELHHQHDFTFPSFSPPPFPAPASGSVLSVRTLRVLKPRRLRAACLLRVGCPCVTE